MLGILTGLLRISSKYTKHGNFTSKRGNKNFYKGRGGNKYGRLNRRGQFVATSMPNWFMPDMTGFRLKAYVMPGEGLVRRNTVHLRVTPKKPLRPWALLTDLTCRPCRVCSLRRRTTRNKSLRAEKNRERAPFYRENELFYSSHASRTSRQLGPTCRPARSAAAPGPRGTSTRSATVGPPRPRLVSHT